MLFLRSNHCLSKHCEWKWGTHVLTRYTFVHTQVITEVVAGKDYVLLGLPATVARSFRRLILSHLLSSKKELRSLVRKAATLDELYVISQTLTK